MYATSTYGARSAAGAVPPPPQTTTTTAAAAGKQLPPYKGVSPRVTADTYASHRGEYVSVIFELSGPGEFTCGVTRKPMQVVGVPDAAEVSRVCEFICYVHPATGELVYYAHALLDDEFDFDVYRRLVALIPRFPQLF